MLTYYDLRGLGGVSWAFFFRFTDLFSSHTFPISPSFRVCSECSSWKAQVSCQINSNNYACKWKHLLIGIPRGLHRCATLTSYTNNCIKTCAFWRFYGPLEKCGTCTTCFESHFRLSLIVIMVRCQELSGWSWRPAWTSSIHIDTSDTWRNATTLGTGNLVLEVPWSDEYRMNDMYLFSLLSFYSLLWSVM